MWSFVNISKHSAVCTLYSSACFPIFPLSFLQPFLVFSLVHPTSGKSISNCWVLDPKASSPADLYYNYNLASIFSTFFIFHPFITFARIVVPIKNPLLFSNTVARCGNKLFQHSDSYFTLHHAVYFFHSQQQPPFQIHSAILKSRFIWSDS